MLLQGSPSSQGNKNKYTLHFLLPAHADSHIWHSQQDLETAMPWLAKKLGTGEATRVTPCSLGWLSTECRATLAPLLSTLAPSEVWPEIDDRAVATPQMTETVMHELPWKAASKYSHKLGDIGIAISYQS